MMEKNSKIFLAAAAVATAVVILASAFVLAGGSNNGQDDSSEKIYVGQYVRYNISGYYGLSSITGTVTISVVDEKAVGETYHLTVRLTQNIRVGMVSVPGLQGTATAELIVDGGGTFASAVYRDGDIIGSETIRINRTDIAATIYSVDFFGQPAKIWVGVADDIIYKTEMTVNGTKITCTLTSTNMV
jgi:hypothetical protein